MITFKGSLLKLEIQQIKIFFFLERINWAILASIAHYSKALQHHNGIDVQWVEMIKGNVNRSHLLIKYF